MGSSVTLLGALSGSGPASAGAATRRVVKRPNIVVFP
jgi:hypothetical protein